MTRTALYRHYDASGVLLYVGITDALARRDREHLGSADWAIEVSRTQTEWLDSRSHAAALERVAIEFEKPIYNKKHSKPDIPKRACIELAGDVDNSQLLKRIEEFLNEAGPMKPTAFGRFAVGDGNLISQLKSGRDVQTKTRARIIAFIEANEASQ